jgi:hypothetical protein
MKETHFDGSRSGRNFSLDRQTEQLVLDSEISGLENLHAFLKYGNYVTRFSFPALRMPPTQHRFIERLKDDFIVREPRRPVEALPDNDRAAAPVDAHWTRPSEKPPLHLLSDAIDQKPPVREKQTELPFHSEL